VKTHEEKEDAGTRENELVKKTPIWKIDSCGAIAVGCFFLLFGGGGGGTVVRVGFAFLFDWFPGKKRLQAAHRPTVKKDPVTAGGADNGEGRKKGARRKIQSIGE